MVNAAVVIRSESSRKLNFWSYFPLRGECVEPWLISVSGVVCVCVCVFHIEICC